MSDRKMAVGAAPLKPGRFVDIIDEYNSDRLENFTVHDQKKIQPARKKVTHSLASEFYLDNEDDSEEAWSKKGKPTGSKHKGLGSYFDPGRSITDFTGKKGRPRAEDKLQGNVKTHNTILENKAKTTYTTLSIRFKIHMKIH
jgi:hypothetical protein